MRQRLLLVAGWITAAVGSVLVASGAVTVAGGQVLDRPLRPLTAAEVAALPVVQVDSSVDFEPQASGGLVSTTGESTDGSDLVEPGSKGPDATGGSTADPEDLRSVNLDDPNEAGTVRIANVEGGKAAFVVMHGDLVLLWASPSPGYVADTRSADESSIAVLFSSNLKVWSVRASLGDDGIEVLSRAEPQS
ncbi:MAG: hypothetical protein GWP18_00230 [Proteobacteria bacterium]|nr:hypothetical protein [Pseudomonadota bacterium]